jgi:hypothetical protein
LARPTPSRKHFSGSRSVATFGIPAGLYDKPETSTLTDKIVFPPRSFFIDAVARRDKLRVLVDDDFRHGSPFDEVWQTLRHLRSFSTKRLNVGGSAKDQSVDFSLPYLRLDGNRTIDRQIGSDSYSANLSPS